MAVDFATLFTRIGKALQVAEDIVTGAATTVPTSTIAFLTEMQSAAPLFQEAVVTGLDSTLASYKSSAGSFLSSLVGTPIQQLIVETVDEDVDLLSTSFDTCLTELLWQMEGSGDTLDACVPSISAIVYGRGIGSSSGSVGDNAGDGIWVTSVKRPDGRNNEFIIAEIVRTTCTALASNGQSTWSVTGEAAVSATDVTWPQGSGTSKTLYMYVAAASANVVPSGEFEDEDENADHLPEEWICSVGVLGTTVVMSSVEVQTITVNGTPTGGWYTLTWQDRNGLNYTTAPLAYNATAAAVQTALRKLPELSNVTATSTGTSPNLTHTVVFVGVRPPGPLSATSGLTGGSPSIVITTTVPASAAVVRGARCLQIVGNGSELTTLQAPLTLAASTQYAVNLWALVDVVPAAGVLVVDLIDSIGGSVVQDEEGTTNTFTINLTTLTTAPIAKNGVFRTPPVLPDEIYLRLRLTTALSAGSTLSIDELCMVPMTELYTSGVWLAGFAGRYDNVSDDYAEITILNDRAGEIHEWLARLLGLPGRRVLFPSVTDGSETIDDALIV